MYFNVCVCVCAGFIHNFEFWEGGNSQVRCDVEGCIALSNYGGLGVRSPVVVDFF